MAAPSLQAHSSGLTCPAASLLMGLAVTILNDSLRAERRAAAERMEWTPRRVSYDVIIVGGGSAGCVLASRLSEDLSLSVLLLESGGQEQAAVASYGAWYGFSHSTFMNWADRSTYSTTSCGGDPNGCKLTSGHGLGGSSAINGMQYVRALPQDLDHWAHEDGLKGWSYQDVLNYFKKSERNVMWTPDGRHLAKDKHGTKGPLDVSHFPFRDPLVEVILTALADQGLNYRDAAAERPAPGMSVFQSTIKEGQRRSANLAFLQPVIHRNNLDVLTHAHVVKILLNSKNKAIGVEYRSLDGVTRNVTALKEVVVSAGALRSPQLLMLSGVGPRRHLEQHGVHVKLDLPVGRTFQDMPVLLAAIRFLLPPSLQRPAALAQMVADWQNRSTQGLMEAEGPRRVMALFDTNDPLHSPLPNVQLRFLVMGGSGSETAQGCPSPAGLEMYYDSIGISPIIMGVRSRGKVMLNSTDPLKPPLIEENFFGDKADLASAVGALQWGAALANSKTFRSLGITIDTSSKHVPACAVESFGSPDYWQCVAKHSAASTSHFTSSCPMGTVLDERLRVRGARGLRVVDASVMPRSPRASTYATTIMIAEKAADMIKEDLSGSGKTIL